MVTFKSRNRVVVFRLTDEEYQSLEEACSARGGRNLSDFTRSRLLAVLEGESKGESIGKRLTEMEQRIMQVQQSIHHLTRVVKTLVALDTDDPQPWPVLSSTLQDGTT